MRDRASRHQGQKESEIGARAQQNTPMCARAPRCARVSKKARTFDSVKERSRRWDSHQSCVGCMAASRSQEVEVCSWDETSETAKKRRHPKDSLRILVGSFAQARSPRLCLGWKPAAVSGSELVLGLGDSNVLVFFFTSQGAAMVANALVANALTHTHHTCVSTWRRLRKIHSSRDI